MKLKIKIKRLNKRNPIPCEIHKGDWIDLRSSELVHFIAPQAETQKKHIVNGVDTRYRNVTFNSRLIGLGVAMQLPKGIEAHVLPRSSTFKNFGIIMANSQGIIDNTYCGNCDEWKFNAVALRASTVYEGDRICQFRIQLSQKATVWQKIKWLLCSGIKFIEVDDLRNKDRGGIGSTGIK